MRLVFVGIDFILLWERSELTVEREFVLKFLVRVLQGVV